MVLPFKAGDKCLNGKPLFPSKIPQNHYIQVTKLLCITSAQMRWGNKKSDFFPPKATLSNKAGFIFFKNSGHQTRNSKSHQTFPTHCLVKFHETLYPCGHLREEP